MKTFLQKFYSYFDSRLKLTELVQFAAKKKVPEHGVKVNELPMEDQAKMQLAGKEIRDAWAKQAEAKGLPGNAVLKDVQTLLGVK